MSINYFKTFLKLSGLAAIITALSISSSVDAQQLPMQQPRQAAEYTDAELVVFINAVHKVMPLQQESQTKMIGAIEEEELTLDKFNNMLESHSNGANVDATAEEITAFNKAIEVIQEIQVEYEVIITEALEEEGITPAKYEEIVTDYQNDPNLQMRINVLMEEMGDDR